MKQQLAEVDVAAAYALLQSHSQPRYSQEQLADALQTAKQVEADVNAVDGFQTAGELEITTMGAGFKFELFKDGQPVGSILYMGGDCRFHLLASAKTPLKHKGLNGPRTSLWATVPPADIARFLTKLTFELDNDRLDHPTGPFGIDWGTLESKPAMVVVGIGHGLKSNYDMM